MELPLLFFFTFVSPTLILAQQVPVPACARACLQDSLLLQYCPPYDLQCSCTYVPYISAWTTCMAKVCSPAIQEQTWISFSTYCSNLAYYNANLKPAGFGLTGGSGSTPNVVDVTSIYYFTATYTSTLSASTVTESAGDTVTSTYTSYIATETETQTETATVTADAVTTTVTEFERRKLYRRATFFVTSTQFSTVFSTPNAITITDSDAITTTSTLETTSFTTTTALTTTTVDAETITSTLSSITTTPTTSSSVVTTTSSSTTTTPHTTTTIDPLSLTSPSPLLEKCGEAAWAFNAENWKKYEVDTLLRNWWEGVQGTRGNRTFVDLLFSSFGERNALTVCGIGQSSLCSPPGCESFKNNGGPNWVYFAQLSVVQINTLYNAVFDSIARGQVDVAGLVPDIASNLIPYKDYRTNLEKAAPWLAVIIEGLVGAVPFAGPGLSAATRTAIKLGSKAIGAGGQVTLGIIANMKSSDPNAQREGTITELGNEIVNFSDTFRSGVEAWAKELFDGNKDANGKDILDYMTNGGFATQLQYSPSQMDKFFKQVSISKIYNEVTRNNSRPYVVCANSTQNIVYTPDASAYTENGKRCRLVNVDKDGNEIPVPGIDQLLDPNYSITAQDLTAASYHTYLFNRLDIAGDDEGFQNAVAASYVKDDGSDSPLSQGVRFGGIYSFAVCDVGTNEKFLSPGNYPCCCGNRCTETAAFFDAAKLRQIAHITDQCAKQCAGSLCPNVQYGGSGRKSVEYPALLLAVVMAIMALG